MAGYEKAYMFGHATYDGIKEIMMELWQGTSSRMWLEPATGFRGRAIKIKTMIPEKPNDPDMLLNAAMAFCPQTFKAVPEYRKMYQKLKPDLFLDFNAHIGVPEEWAQVRELVRPIFEKMTIYSADIKPLQGVSGWYR